MQCRRPDGQYIIYMYISIEKNKHNGYLRKITVVVPFMSILLILILWYVETNEYWVFEKPEDETL